MLRDNKKQLKVIILLIILIVIAVGLLIFGNISQAGKLSVNIEVAPSDAKVTANGIDVGSGKVYLKPAQYTFIAHKEGFDDAKRTVTIDSNDAYVGLMPLPDSDVAEAWASDENNAQTIERIAAKMAESQGRIANQKTPILSLLPHIDPTGPFRIDYGFRSNDATSAYLSVTYSTPNGRTEAIKWIKDSGYDITTLDIIFDDYYPPYYLGES